MIETAETTDRETYLAELEDAASAMPNPGALTFCNGKMPLGGDGWQNRELTLEEGLQLLATAACAALGLKEGPISGVITADVDGPGDQAAFDHLHGDDMPVYAQCRTGRDGGKRYFMQMPPELADTGAATIDYHDGHGNKVTFRIGCKRQEDGSLAGSHSIIPPSLHYVKDENGNWRPSGRRYEWLPGLSLEDVGAVAMPDEVKAQLIAAHLNKQVKGASRPNRVDGADPAALEIMLKAKVADGGDGSKRLFGYACRAVEHDLSDPDAVATIRAAIKEKPLPRHYSDPEIIQRVRDAERTVERGTALELSNGREVEIEVEGEDGEPETKTVLAPLTMREIMQEIDAATSGWPRRVGSALFVDDQEHGIGWLEKPQSLSGWMHTKRRVNWYSRQKFITMGETFAELQRTAQSYETIEVMPHHPAMEGVYYRCQTPPAGDGRYLRQLVDFFRPSTTIDRDLITSAFVTPAWGGPPGCRPAFVVTAKQGRGAGKTTLVKAVAHLYGGFIDVAMGEDIGVLKQRLLSADGLTKRIVVADNIKSMKLSWAELESLITSNVVSGKRLYVGEAQRPNTLSWYLTLNGVALATDMAQRSVIIEIDRGDNSGTFHERLNGFIDRHRMEIIGDCIGLLQSSPYPLASYSRWAAWEKDVLSRLPEPDEAQRVILERQGEANCELDEGEILEDYFAERLDDLNYTAATAQVRIPVAVAGEWYCAAINDRVKTAGVTRRLNQMFAEGQIKRISPDTSRTYGRCFVWTGPEADVMGSPIANDLLSRIEHSKRGY